MLNQESQMLPALVGHHDTALKLQNKCLTMGANDLGSIDDHAYRRIIDFSSVLLGTRPGAGQSSPICGWGKAFPFSAGVPRYGTGQKSFTKKRGRAS
jgi:hypothetical protein